MKHSITVKFIAVLLCTLSLLGAVASAGSIAVLTESGLYSKSVDEVMEQSIQGSGTYLSRREALCYAGEKLGGCPEDLLRAIYGDQSGISGYDTYGFAILDEEGNVLKSQNPELKDSGKTYTFPVSGQYMHLISQMPVDEKFPQTTEASEPDHEGLLNGQYGVVDILPTDGSQVAVYNITVGYADESGEGYGSILPIGLISHEASGQVVFRSNPGEIFLDGETITYISFRAADDTVLYEAASDTSVGTVYFLDGAMVFESGEVQALDIPRPTDVYHVQFYSSAEPDRVIFELKASSPIGVVEYAEDGRLAVTLHSLQNMQMEGEGAVGFPVSRVSLFDADGRILKDYTGPGGVTMSEDQTYLHYQSTNSVVSAAAVAANRNTPAETIPSETMVEIREDQPSPDPSAQAMEDALKEASSAGTAPTEEMPGETAAMVPVSEPTEETSVPTSTESTVPVTEAPETSATEASAPPETQAAAETQPEEAPELINGKALSEYGINDIIYYSSQHEEMMYAEYIYLPLPEYTVEVYLGETNPTYEAAFAVLQIIRTFRNDLFLYLGVSLLILAITAVFLCVSAGHKTKTGEIHAGGLNCLPLDLYFCLGVTALTGLATVGVEGTQYLLRNNLVTACGFALAAAFLACLTIVAFCFAFVAQVKTPGGYLWRNTLLVRVFTLWMKLLVRLEKWLTRKLFPWLVKAGKALWKAGKALWKTGVRMCLTAYRFAGQLLKTLWSTLSKAVKKAGTFLGGTLRRFFALLPLTWQWTLGGFFLIVVLMITGKSDFGGILLGMAVCMAVVLYVSHCFGTLLESTKRMSKGDLDSKVDDKFLAGCFQEFAGDLNDLADVAVVAAQKQLKSERMKTELITNVSHDIKTPLTSIINYVDLLQKPHTEEEGDMYLEVLQRQSQRLKKLIEDLMDMSKASTGNMAVDPTELDAVECVNQALGEFADKLERAQLIPVFRHSDESAMMVGDGRLVWRVFSNLLGNAVKYAMPGTRLYIDLQKLEGKVVISLKNISRDELNVDAEELMERFVRGDDSRNTEGSGLGLNIAKSLMELQKGQLQLLVDGDLFKVTLIFPGV